MEKLGIVTGGDLFRKDEEWLLANFASSGNYLFLAARGINHHRVNPDQVRKSLGGELTYFDNKRSEEKLREPLNNSRFPGGGLRL